MLFPGKFAVAEVAGTFYVFGGKDMTLEEDVALVEEVEMFNTSTEQWSILLHPRVRSSSHAVLTIPEQNQVRIVK